MKITTTHKSLRFEPGVLIICVDKNIFYQARVRGHAPFFIIIIIIFYFQPSL